MTRRFLIAFAAVAALLLGSCIHNNLPYPRIQANFVNFEVAGEDAAAAIDTTARIVTVTLPEDADIYNVRVTGYTLSPGAEIVDNPFYDAVDLSEPMFLYLRLYQDWLWKIVAQQNIERYFEIDYQMGETTIDVPARRVVLYIRGTADLSAVTIKRIKLGPIGSVMTPDLTEGSVFDGTRPLEITIENYGHTENWTVYVQPVSESVKIDSYDVWTSVAWVYATAEAGLDNGVEYRIAGTDEWTTVPSADLTENGGSYTACIKHLSPDTQYEARAFSEGEYTDIVTFTTGSNVQLPNSDFESWWLNGRIWNPWPEDGTSFWDTGNAGAATIGQSNTVPTDDTPTGTGWAAKLETKYIVVKLAAGNIFTGTYVRTDGTNGVLSFGRPFTERPTGMRGQFKYTCKTIDKGTELPALIGQPDTAIVWMALVDCPDPIEIRTNPSNRNLFDPSASYVVAYGKMQCAQTVDSYIPFEFTLDYTSTSRVPKYVIVCASASKYGDYFTGGVGSTLYIDDFELVYDY